MCIINFQAISLHIYARLYTKHTTRQEHGSLLLKRVMKKRMQKKQQHKITRINLEKIFQANGKHSTRNQIGC